MSDIFAKNYSVECKGCGSNYGIRTREYSLDDIRCKDCNGNDIKIEGENGEVLRSNDLTLFSLNKPDVAIDLQGRGF